MANLNKKGASSLIIALVRYSKDEVVSILGGLVMAAGVTTLSISRLVK